MSERFGRYQRLERHGSYSFGHGPGTVPTSAGGAARRPEPKSGAAGMRSGAGPRGRVRSGSERSPSLGPSAMIFIRMIARSRFFAREFDRRVIAGAERFAACLDPPALFPLRSFVPLRYVRRHSRP